jgi:hypothetical protein
MLAVVLVWLHCWPLSAAEFCHFLSTTALTSGQFSEWPRSGPVLLTGSGVQPSAEWIDY